MEKKFRQLHLCAISNLGTRIQLELSSETDDLRSLVTEALYKLSHYNTRCETFKLVHIDSIERLKTPNLDV